MLSPRAAHRAWGRRMRRSVRWNFAVLPVTLGRREVRSRQPPALGVCQRGMALKVRRSDHHIDHGFSRPGAEHERPRYLERAGSARRSQANASSSAHGTASHARASSAPQCACTASVRCARLAWAMGNTGSHSRSPVSHSACENPHWDGLGAQSQAWLCAHAGQPRQRQGKGEALLALVHGAAAVPANTEKEERRRARQGGQ